MPTIFFTMLNIVNAFCQLFYCSMAPCSIVLLLYCFIAISNNETMQDEIILLIQSIYVKIQPFFVRSRCKATALLLYK